jgi:hypothetical protein
MRTRGIAPGDAVLVVEHRGEQQIVYNALVAAISMQEKLAGTHGEPAITVAFVLTRHAYSEALGGGYPVMTPHEVVHISHRDWIERRASLGYEELPAAVPGVCRYCRCTEQRACAGGCTWIDDDGVLGAGVRGEVFGGHNKVRTKGAAR